MELNGKPVNTDSSFLRVPFLIFKDKDYRITGNGCCNILFGIYTLLGADHIHISKVGTTLMACLHMDIESEFLKVLQAADTYQVVGDMLILNKTRMAPLAGFKTVYMK